MKKQFGETKLQMALKISGGRSQVIMLLDPIIDQLLCRFHHSQNGTEQGHGDALALDYNIALQCWSFQSFQPDIRLEN